MGPSNGPTQWFCGEHMFMCRRACPNCNTPFSGPSQRVNFRHPVTPLSEGGQISTHDPKFRVGMGTNLAKTQHMGPTCMCAHEDYIVPGLPARRGGLKGGSSRRAENSHFITGFLKEGHPQGARRPPEVRGRSDIQFGYHNYILRLRALRDLLLRTHARQVMRCRK